MNIYDERPVLDKKKIIKDVKSGYGLKPLFLIMGLVLFFGVIIGLAFAFANSKPDVLALIIDVAVVAVIEYILFYQIKQMFIDVHNIKRGKYKIVTDTVSNGSKSESNGHRVTISEDPSTTCTLTFSKYPLNSKGKHDKYAVWNVSQYVYDKTNTGDWVYLVLVDNDRRLIAAYMQSAVTYNSSQIYD